VAVEVDLKVDLMDQEVQEVQVVVVVKAQVQLHNLVEQEILLLLVQVLLKDFLVE
tara:strand:+ start:225 stop:389 length:165 start_codon:yes stop_codon:yes gene_type:complete